MTCQCFKIRKFHVRNTDFWFFFKKKKKTKMKWTSLQNEPHPVSRSGKVTPFSEVEKWPGVHCADWRICLDPITGNESTIPEPLVISVNITTTHSILPQLVEKTDRQFRPSLSLNFTSQKQKSTNKNISCFSKKKKHTEWDSRRINLLLGGLLMSLLSSL